MPGPFLPVTPEEVAQRGWDAPDFVYAVGEAYVDHPSFGHAIIGRVLEAAGYRVAMLCLPEYHSAEAFKRFGRPKLGFLVSSGVIDSMVNHYTVARKRRNTDVYAPGGRAGLRPDRAVTVYCNRIHEAYPGIPVLIGGVEASLRRFSHYDYWDNKVRRSVLVDSAATLTIGAGTTLYFSNHAGIDVYGTLRAEGTPEANVTLRGDRMYYFADKLMNIVLPRVRDFRGISDTSFDGRGNYAMGLKEQLIFPEINYDDVDKIRGMDIVFVTTAKTDEEAKELLKLMGMPFVQA